MGIRSLGLVGGAGNENDDHRGDEHHDEQNTDDELPGGVVAVGNSLAFFMSVCPAIWAAAAKAGIGPVASAAFDLRYQSHFYPSCIGSCV